MGGHAFSHRQFASLPIGEEDPAHGCRRFLQWMCRRSNKKYKLSFYQWYVRDSSEKTNQIMLPIFDVKWGEGQVPFYGVAAKVTILGTTKELMGLRIGDEMLSRRPQMIITNAFELSSTPDPPLKQLQRPFGILKPTRLESVLHRNPFVA